MDSRSRSMDRVNAAFDRWSAGLGRLWDGTVSWLGHHAVLNVTPGRALVEALLLSCVVLVALLQGVYPPDVLAAGALVAALGGALVCAVRLRLPQGSRWRQLGFEIGVALALMGGLAGVATVYYALAAYPRLLAEHLITEHDLVGFLILGLLGATALAFLIGAIPFLIYRAGIRLLVFLNRVRRRYLRWALTSANLAIIIGLLLLIASPGLVTLWQELAHSTVRENGEPAPVALRILLFLILSLAPDLVLLALVLMIGMPIFAVIALALTRGVTRRLEALVAATSAIRSGDYGARVAVGGEDEIAQLQADFNAMAADLQRTLRELEEAREKADRLLLNILPEPIAARLKEEDGLIADSFPAVTVLFADIVDFTRISTQLSPRELVAWLNDLFSAFDRLADKHGLEKIKTIGDAYMVVGGLPTPRADHAEAVANMALDMQRELTRRTTPNGEAVHMRIGMNTGEVVAGVIGTRKFIYDLWGDAVNTASRMESQGLSGIIQVTAATYEYLADRYHLEKRGTVPIKGKGEMVTYLLHGHKTPTPVARPESVLHS